MVFVWTLDVTPEWPRSSAFYFPEHHAWEVRQSKLLCRICSDMLWLLVAMIHHDTSWYIMIPLVVWNVFYFPIYWEYCNPIIFQRGSNHQPDRRPVQFHVVCNMVLRAHGFPCETERWTMKSDENRWRSAKNGPYHAHVSFESWNCVRIRRFRSVEHGTSMEWFIFTGFAV